MKTLITLLLLITLPMVAQNPFAPGGLVVQKKVAAGGGGGGGGCPADGSASSASSGSTTASYVGLSSGYYLGQINWQDSSVRTICKLGFQLTADNGSVVGKTFTAYIFAASGGGFTAASPLATSNGVTGNDAWSSTMVRFTFPTPFTTTANTSYALVLSMGQVDASHCPRMDQNGSSQIVGYWDGFDSSGTAQINGSGTHDVVMEIYWQ